MGIGLGGTIMDGEYLLKDKSNSNINLFMVFDIYFDKYTDVRSRQLDRTKKQKSQNDNLSRLEIMNNIFDSLVIDKDDTNNFEIRKKKFLMGNIDEYDINVNQQITDFETQLKTLEVGS